ncbi:efflux RND transporter permease subunit [Edaphobacter flagellatus]|uniref:efflux RND transporter permease subunit n=1 Tax=Edaphobacter flagellatus TaxID=1933044 RepID=UPI0021B356B2|nr:CusA/CzcA family heavy metal efflux RND transporter [Edaphobacter flagellatus]
MFGKILTFALSHRWGVLLGVVALIAAGGWAVNTIPVDAFPDLTNNQVVIVTDAPSMPPSEVEQLVTYPIERTLMGMPNQLEVRSLSKLGLSMVTVVFDDGVPTYFARQLVNERLQQVTTSLPAGIQPILSPPSTAFGELYQYTLKGGGLTPMELKDVQEWQIKPWLRTVPGVSDVNTWGGETRQYQIRVDPALLQQYGLTLKDVATRVAENNTNFGGGYIEHAYEQYTLRGLGRTSTVADIGNIVLLANQGAPVMLHDVAEVKIGPAPRQGAVLRNGESISGMVIMLKGENGKQVIEQVKQKIAGLHLLAGITLEPFYDQSTVIDGTIHTVEHNLFEGFILVTVVLLLFLGSFRAALVTASIIPLSLLFSFLGMKLFGISANLMSLGAIDFGMIVDGAVVMIENSVHRMHEHGHEEDGMTSILTSGLEVARPMAFGVGIIIAVYLPILFLQGLEGRMFRPMAITVCTALLGSLLLALTVIPVLSSFVFRKGLRRKKNETNTHHWMDRLSQRYTTGLSWVIRHRIAVITAMALVMIGSLASLAFIGTEFMPRLDEGSILVETRKLPGISLTDSIEISKRVEKALRAFPEIQDVTTKIGRPDFATEAMGINEGDVYVALTPTRQWTRFHTKEELIDAMDKALAKIPGISYDFTQPMAMRLDETVSGVKADLAIKIFGDDFQQLDSLAQQVLRQVNTIQGAADAQMEINSGVAELSVQIRRDALARYGLNVSDVQQAVEAGASGAIASEVIEGQRRYTIALRLPDRYRTDAQSMSEIPLHAPGGETVTLGQIADVLVSRGAEKINREQGQRRIVVMSNVRGRDLGSFVEEVQQKVGRNVQLPAGYTITYGGQFENQQRAMQRLLLVIPLALGIVCGLLYMTFHSFKQALLILINVPFALVGGIAALWIFHLNLNLSASVGFIALLGVAVLNGVVLVSSINQLRDAGESMDIAVLHGAQRRLRPVLMTALVASLGFIPMAISTSTGAEVQRPLATVVIGGLVSSTLLTLFLLPTIYEWFDEH